MQNFSFPRSLVPSSLYRGLCWLPLAVLPGCGSVAATDYLGEAMLSLSGSVVVDNPQAPSELVPVLAFERPGAGGRASGYALSDVEYRGDFPARFELGVYEPPPLDAMYAAEDGAGLAYAWGRIGAVAPVHPELLTPSNSVESSFCLGKECYTDVLRCGFGGGCYGERRHCSLPERFDPPGVAYQGCREVGTRGDVTWVPAAPVARSGYEDSDCDGDRCQVTYESCADETGACEPRADGSCRPPESQCFARILDCSYVEAAPAAPAPEELDPLRWSERQDLSGCGVVGRSGDLALAEDPNEWFAGLSDEAFVVYLPDGFDPAAFEQRVGVPAPERSGYSLLTLAPWSAETEGAYSRCREQTEPPLVDAYNAAHGTRYVLSDEGIDAGTELGSALLDNLLRCSLRVRSSWDLDPASADLELHVALPPVFD